LKKGGGSFSRGSSSGKDKESPFGAFIIGCILIGFALPMVWMNERKQVKIYKLIEKARTSCIPEVPATEVSENDNFKLIHTSAHTATQSPSEDQQFGVVVNDSMKLKRVVEMHQWVEVKTDGSDG
jgi:hypothetical protein